MSYLISTAKEVAGQAGFDCEKCLNDKKPGRLRQCVGRTLSKGEFWRRYKAASKKYHTGNLRILLKRLNVCAKSFPVDPLSAHLLEIVFLCQDGERNLRFLPEAGGLYDQPALFFEARELINAHLRVLEKRDENPVSPK